MAPKVGCTGNAAVRIRIPPMRGFGGGFLLDRLCLVFGRGQLKRDRT